LNEPIANDPPVLAPDPEPVVIVKANATEDSAYSATLVEIVRADSNC
jgi:hypothetical protein